MKALGLFAIVTLAIIGVAGWVLSLVYDSPADRHAIVVSAWVAFVVQLITFAVARFAFRTNVIAGWGLGSVIRLLVLVAYGFVVVKAMHLPSSPALLSLALFFFLSMLVEPLLLNT